MQSENENKEKNLKDGKKLKAFLEFDHSIIAQENSLNRAIQAIDTKKKKHKDTLLKYEQVLREREISLFKVVATMDVGDDVFDTSTIKESLKNKLIEKEDHIKEPKIKLLDKKSVKNLGC